MTFDNQVASMTPGQALLDVPIAKLIENTAKAIAAAQYELDASAVRAATLLSETRVGFRDENGDTRERSLLELGFTPSFYHFSETEMEFRVTISVKVESGIDFGVSGEIGGRSQSMSFGATLSLDVHHKYGFDMEAASTVRTVMKAVPPPQIFIGALQTHAGQGGTLVAPENGDDGGGETPGGDSDGPVSDDPGSDDPGTDDPGTDDPGTDDPGSDDPGSDDPGSDDPDGGDTPG